MPDTAIEAPGMTFPADVAAFVRRAYSRSRWILEYGSGGSTVLAAEQTDARVLSIESDRAWAENLRTYLATAGIEPTRVDIRWIDIGPTKKWGYPAGTAHWKRYPAYALDPWEKLGAAPDLVLIDGRFRLACLAAAMLHCKAETTVLFDDYTGRPHYHQAEQFLKPVNTVGRMAEFRLAPRSFDGAELSTLLRWFFSVR